MPTPGERRALLFLSAVAALGVAVRGWRELRPHADNQFRGDSAGLTRQLGAVDTAIAKEHARGRGRGRAPGRGDSTRAQPKAPRPRVERPGARGRGAVDSAAPDPFAHYNQKRLAAESVNARVQWSLDAAEAARVHRQDSIRARWAPAPSATPAAAKARVLVDLDVASAAEIARLPYIGVELAQRIVEDRSRRGPFGSLEGFARVPGVGHWLATRVQDRVTFSKAYSATHITPFPRLRKAPVSRP